MHSYIFPSKIFDRVLNIPLGQYVWELVFRNFNSFFTNSFIPGRCLLLNFALLLQNLKKWLHDYRVKKKNHYMQLLSNLIVHFPNIPTVSVLVCFPGAPDWINLSRFLHFSPKIFYIHLIFHHQCNNLHK